MADFKKFSNFAGKKFGGGFKKPFEGGWFNKGGFDKWGFDKFKKPEEEEENPLKWMMGGETEGEEKETPEEEKKEWTETEGEEKTEEETVEAIIDLFDKLAPLVEKLRK